MMNYDLDTHQYWSRADRSGSRLPSFGGLSQRSRERTMCFTEPAKAFELTYMRIDYERE